MSTGHEKRLGCASWGDLLALIDPCAVEHALDVIKNWSALPDQQYTVEDADTVVRLLIAPLDRWLRLLPPGCDEEQAGRALAECMESDIAYGFRTRQKISAAQIARLEGAWSEFQRVVGASTVVKEQQRQSRLAKTQTENARKARSSVTKDTLEAFAAAYRDKRAQAGEMSPNWGLWAAIQRKFSIDRKTAQKKMRE